MVNKKIDEAVFDVLLEHAFADVIEEDIKKLRDEAEPCTISAETEQKIKKLIAQAGKRENRKSTKTVIRVASIVLIILLNVSLIGLLMIPSVNAEVKNVFSELFEKYVSYETVRNNRKVVTTSEYEIGYIPDGFELILNDDSQVRFREQINGNGYIMINISYDSFGHVSMDAENSISQIIKVNGIDATLYCINDEYILFWFDGYHFISIYSNIAESEIIKIANDMKRFQ